MNMLNPMLCSGLVPYLIKEKTQKLTAAGGAFHHPVHNSGCLFLPVKAQATPGPDPEGERTGDERERYLDNLSDYSTVRHGGADDCTCSLCDVWEGKQQTI